MSWTCPGHSIQNYIYILHMYTNYKILINVKLLISQDPVIGFMRFWTFLKALVLIYLCINLLKNWLKTREDIVSQRLGIVYTI